MSGKRAYRCQRTGCSYRKWIAGRDSDLPRTIRTGCEYCETITRFKKQGIG